MAGMVRCHVPVHVPVVRNPHSRWHPQHIALRLKPADRHERMHSAWPPCWPRAATSAWELEAVCACVCARMRVLLLLSLLGEGVRGGRGGPEGEGGHQQVEDGRADHSTHKRSGGLERADRQ